MKKCYVGLLLTISMLMLCGCQPKARTIAVEECVGVSMVSNAKGDTQAHEGQHLENGDFINVGDEATLLLLLDTDKHVFADNGAKFHVVSMYENKAEKTLIEQSSGTLVYGIDHPLEASDTFMVTTKNVLLAVRGTVFTVDTSKDTTTLSVKEGTVYTETIEDGKSVTRFVEAGDSISYTGTAPAFHDVTFSGAIASAISTESKKPAETESASKENKSSPYAKLTTQDVLTDVIEWDMHNVPRCVPGECSHLECNHFYSTGSAYKVSAIEESDKTINLAEGRFFANGGCQDSGVNLPFQMECSSFEDYPSDLAENDLWNPMQGWYYWDETSGIFRRCDSDSHGGNY